MFAEPLNPGAAIGGSPDGAFHELRDGACHARDSADSCSQRRRGRAAGDGWPCPTRTRLT